MGKIEVDASEVDVAEENVRRASGVFVERLLLGDGDAQEFAGTNGADIGSAFGFEGNTATVVAPAKEKKMAQPMFRNVLAPEAPQLVRTEQGISAHEAMLQPKMWGGTGQGQPGGGVPY